MLHELAHCRWKNHSDNFGKYMAELERVRCGGKIANIRVATCLSFKPTKVHAVCDWCACMLHCRLQDLQAIKADRSRFPGNGRNTRRGLFDRLPGEPIYGCTMVSQLAQTGDAMVVLS